MRLRNLTEDQEELLNHDGSIQCLQRIDEVESIIYLNNMGMKYQIPDDTYHWLLKRGYVHSLQTGEMKDELINTPKILDSNQLHKIVRTERRIILDKHRRSNKLLTTGYLYANEKPHETKTEIDKSLKEVKESGQPLACNKQSEIFPQHNSHKIQEEELKNTLSYNDEQGQWLKLNSKKKKLVILAEDELLKMNMEMRNKKTTTETEDTYGDEFFAILEKELQIEAGIREDDHHTLLTKMPVDRDEKLDMLREYMRVLEILECTKKREEKVNREELDKLNYSKREKKLLEKCYIDLDINKLIIEMIAFRDLITREELTFMKLMYYTHQSLIRGDEGVTPIRDITLSDFITFTNSKKTFKKYEDQIRRNIPKCNKADYLLFKIWTEEIDKLSKRSKDLQEKGIINNRIMVNPQDIKSTEPIITYKMMNINWNAKYHSITKYLINLSGLSFQPEDLKTISDTIQNNGELRGRIEDTLIYLGYGEIQISLMYGWVQSAITFTKE